MDSPKDEPPVFLDRTSRATRGKRMTKLLDEEVEEDETFWNQEALKEDEDDNNYEAEPEIADEFDSDFDEDEPEPEEGGDNNDGEERRTRKRLIFPGKQSGKKKKIKVLSKIEDSAKDQKAKAASKPEQPPQDGPDGEEEKSVRKSTRTAVVVRQAEREAIRAAYQATMRPMKRKKEGEEKRMSQEDMLLEAAQTELINLRTLERVLAREEEVKKRAVVHKAVYTGPQLRYFSKDGCNYLEFSRGLSFQSEISTKSAPYPEKSVCAVTGLPAKYRDPKTGLPYATKEAFQIIRQRFLQESCVVRKEMDLGDLYDTLSGKGFSARQKRSVVSNRSEVSYPRQFTRFRRVPALESVSSEE